MTSRSAGVLCPVFSLPGAFGIGTLGQEARDFIDWLAQSGCGWWQILPLCQPGQANSPYDSISAFAGSIYAIDPLELVKMGLLTPKEGEEQVYHGPLSRIDYDWVAQRREAMLRLAYPRRSDQIKEEAAAFAKKNQGWLDGYSAFMANRKTYGEKSFLNWPKGEEKSPQWEEEKSFWVFAQYLFDTQWRELKHYANLRGIGIIGDLPIYVAFESADVWQNKELFLLDEEGRPRLAAGVPPDYFSPEGQLWGNPLYDYEKMAEDGYGWWMGRLAQAKERYDCVRIDHFRGLYNFWAVPPLAKTAKEGGWQKGPGMGLISQIKEKFGAFPIIAEDLGQLDDKARRFVECTGFPGMRVLQFGFEEGADSLHLPHNYPLNSVAYTGTHDNNTTLGWLWEQEEKTRRFAMDYCALAPGEDYMAGGPGAPGVRCMMRTLWSSPAALSIAPITDLLGYGADCRTNCPGTVLGNWEYRITLGELTSIDVGFLQKCNRLYGRWGRFDK